MNQYKFKAGQTVWHVIEGMVTLEKIPATEALLWMVRPNGTRITDVYAKDGKTCSDHPCPAIITIEEARLRGCPVAEPLPVIEGEVWWKKAALGDCVCYPTGDLPWSKLIGRRTKIRIEEIV